jgi:hypothetical protein
MSARPALLAVVVTLLAGEGCGGGESGGAGTSEVMSVTNVSEVVTTMATPRTVTSTTSEQPPAATSTDPASDLVDPVAGIVAAVASYWRPVSSSRTLHVVERLGTADSVGFIEYSDKSPEITDEQRDFIAKALAPQAVSWVRHPDEVGGTVPPMFPSDGVVGFSEPVVDGSRARVYANHWDRFGAGGLGFVVEQTTGGEWTVTDEFDGWVS